MSRSPKPLCPYLDRRDSRCAGVLTLTNLRQALGHCADRHEHCSIYYRIRLSDSLAGLVQLPVAQSA